MRIALKLSAIDQEHLQELYNASGVARDELPYTEAFETLCQGFQDRTFKNASRDQVFAALLKYTRSSTNSAVGIEAVNLTDDQRKQLKAFLPRHSVGGKILPYSDEFDAALKEFNAHAGLSLTEKEFWRSVIGAQGIKRRPPSRKAIKPAVEVEEEEAESAE